MYVWDECVSVECVGCEWGGDEPVFVCDECVCA